MPSYHSGLPQGHDLCNFAKGLEIRLSLNPPTLFSDVSLPNHTKMFELVHMVTSMEDFALEHTVRYIYSQGGRDGFFFTFLNLFMSTYRSFTCL
jgi:hypothetical protein